MNMEREIYNVSVDDIIPNRFQPRLTFDDKALQELSDSIKEHGIIQPLVLRKLGSNNAANRVLGKMGVSGKIGKKSNTVLSNMIRNSNWIGNIIADYGASSIMGGVSSIVWGYHFDGRWF